MSVATVAAAGPGRVAPVQAAGRRPADLVRRRGESLAIFAVFAVLYLLVGSWLVVGQHVVGFETLDRFNRALLMLQDRPPSPAALGVDYPPLAVAVALPFALVPSSVTSLTVVPIVSAIPAALTMVVLHTLLRRTALRLPLRLAVLAALGLNPLVVLHASVGSRSFLWLALVVAAVGALVAWHVTGDVRYVLAAGLALAVAALAGYAALVWFAAGLAVVAGVLIRLGAGRDEVEGTAIGYVAPTAFALAAWSATAVVLAGDPFRWLTDGRDAPDPGAAGLSLLEVAQSTGQLLVLGAPVAVVVLPALVHAGLTRGDAFALGLGLLLLLAVLAPGAAALAGLTDRPMAMSNALPILLLAVVGAAWLARSAAGGPGPVAAVLVVGLLASIPVTFAAMAHYEHQGLERAFHDAVATGAGQDGARSPDGAVVGYDHERAMADYIVDNVDEPDSILTDDRRTYAVMLLTGRPDLFVDRADHGDAAWRDIADAPAGRVRYLLLSTDVADDDLSRRRPAAAVGADPALAEVFSTPRYTLVEVPADVTAAGADEAAS